LFSRKAYIRRKSKFSQPQLTEIDNQLQQLLQQDSERLSKTHFFHGRYENIYLDAPASDCGLDTLDSLIDESLNNAADLLQTDKSELKIGYWFNLMQPGQVTTLHRHDDFDELLSGVVYLAVPEHSGDLILQVNNQEIVIPPVSGDFVYFSPETPHRVSENLSTRHRLSIGMNIGPRSSLH
jgi:hypothetical protein